MPPRSQSKAAPVQAAPVRPAPADEETFDDVSDTTDSSEEEDTPAPADETTHVAPIIKAVIKSNRALDIDLLFDRGKGKPSVCKYCK